RWPSIRRDRVSEEAELPPGDTVMVEAFDPRGLVALLERGKAEACGGGPLAATMLAAQALGADRARVLHYANSGDVTGDHSQVVGYMAAALCRSSGQAG
ncbi:MAG: AmmeMemoRadiSam system protein B, partial [Anaerolineae bacterium]|nr:AmmeMemoRadiSam system protein B [Anaerolineae bacterium]